ncbi:MAG: hypothetical protein JRJ77_13365 [Deltaproteobacteria bacterium]|nr:hypothetical protein [Deltaproteobacteria bacterium]
MLEVIAELEKNVYIFLTVLVRDQVKSADIPFMFKHWPGRTQNSTEALLEGRRWEEFPESVIKNMDWD